MRFWLMCALLLLSFTVRAAEPHGPPVDRLFVEQGDVTNDGQRSILAVHVWGASMQDPFHWTFTISDQQGRVLFKEDHDDALLDSNFHDPNFVGKEECSDYETCKTVYYFHDLPRMMTHFLTPEPNAWNLQDNALNQDFNDIVRQELWAAHYSPTEIEQAVAEMRVTLSKPGYHMVDVKDSPWVLLPPRVWVACLHRFVTFYMP